MARSIGTRGNVTPFLSLSGLNTSGGGASAIAPGDDLISVNLTDGEGDPVTFSDYASGSSAKALEVEFIYSGVTGSFYDILWKNAGRTGVTWIYGLHGNSVASAGKPIYTGTLTMPPKPNVETEAGTDEFTVSVTFQLDTYDRTTAA